MYVDAQNLFSDAQAITAAAASDNYIDLQAVRNLGVGQPLYVVCLVDVAFTDGSSDSTLTVALEGDSSTSFTPDGTRDLFTFAALSAAGTVKVAPLHPGGSPESYRYIRLKYTPNNGNFTTCSVTAFLTTDVQQYSAYADAITIS